MNEALAVHVTAQSNSPLSKELSYPGPDKKRMDLANQINQSRLVKKLTANNSRQSAQIRLLRFALEKAHILNDKLVSDNHQKDTYIKQIEKDLKLANLPQLNLK